MVRNRRLDCSLSMMYEKSCEYLWVAGRNHKLFVTYLEDERLKNSGDAGRVVKICES